ncbi:hypothetical protein BHU72_06030 [Desulfuribacillus stibiiarsenatis]|uniref:Uncharacterized protein n=1 Tax=Desulfuribacillus stibiiarsenatis TaxID=1390249 RepID=A0A1E5L4U2_9FIRM|nr:hypothetical protein [Desulfuribacillus stibiiarsenatis]OEH85167.1 hypothetical protein BHU72_06030 [Desulfuribacillus stibiiarsenatis]
MSIKSARYINGEEKAEYFLNQVDSKLYNNKLKGFLFCPTESCVARVIFSGGSRKYFKTWNKDDHIEKCIYQFERIKGRVGTDTTNFINVELSEERKKRALREAYLLYNMTEEEKARIREDKKNKKNNPTTVTKRKKPSVSLVLSGGTEEAEIARKGLRGPNLPKRTVDMLKETDENTPRLIMGIVKEVILHDDKTATIIVSQNNSEIRIKFQEAFMANSPNYLGLFNHLRRYVLENENAVFSGIGEVWRSSLENSFMLSVFYGEDFEVNQRTLLSIAAYYTFTDQHY